MLLGVLRSSFRLNAFPRLASSHRVALIQRPNLLWREWSTLCSLHTPRTSETLRRIQNLSRSLFKHSRALHEGRPNLTQEQRPFPILPTPSVGRWLVLSSVLVLGIIVVGGVTRLTESGLSITEWQPITGILPPLSHAEWMVEFDKYKETPEFKL